MSAPALLPLARYRFTFRMSEPLRLPEFAGSLLRGQFGAALRRVSCMTHAPSCEGCPLRATCPYPAVFEAPAPAHHALQQFSHIPNPYVIEPPPIGTTRIDAGEPLRFNLVLFGRALDHLPLISFALQRAFGQGLGQGHTRSRGQLERIEVQQAVVDAVPTWVDIWEHGAATIAPHETRLPVPGSDAAPTAAGNTAQIRLQFETPLRLQMQGKPVRAHALTPRKLVADLLRRITLLAEFHADRPGLVPKVHDLVRQADALQHQHDLQWHDWSRYSSRQQREMTLGGVLGSWTLRGENGELNALLPWLTLGQWLHVGKNATLGLGAYRLDTTFAAN